MEDNQADVVILTAVDIEFSAVMQCFDNWNSLVVENDTHRYYKTFLQRNDKKIRIVTVQQKIIGMTEATFLATKSLELFKPRYLIMCGIAASTKPNSDNMYGDSIIPDVVWDYSSGKYVKPNQADICLGDVGFVPRPSFIHLDKEIKKIIQNTATLPENEFCVHIGALACGSSVIANSKIVDKRILSVLSHTIGIDMESYAIFLLRKIRIIQKLKR